MARGFHNLKFNLIVFRLKTWVYRNYLRVFVAFHSLVQIESFRSTLFVSIFMYIILKKRQPRELHYNEGGGNGNLGNQTLRVLWLTLVHGINFMHTAVLDLL